MPAPWLKISVLGPVVVERLTPDGTSWTSVQVTNDEALELLVRLAASDDDLDRTEAIAAIRGHGYYHDQLTYEWARTLRNYLDAGRHYSAGALKRSRTHTLSLNRKNGLWIDYDEFRTLREDGEDLRALSLVRGDLAAGIRRSRLRDLRDTLLEELNDSRAKLDLPAVTSVKQALADLPLVGQDGEAAAGKGDAPGGGTGVSGALEPPRSFHHSLVGVLRSEFELHNYSEVIRFGEALSRPLFEAGAFSARLDVGRMVEDSAARSSRTREQYVALIDSIGWSLVELGQYPAAARELNHGLRLLSRVADPFYEAKAHRHLGVIARREHRYEDARVEYEIAQTCAAQIEEARDGLAMNAGLEYALGSLALYQGDLDEAEERIKSAIEDFGKLGDEYRLNMALVMRADIEFRRDAADEARDTYRLVLQSADRNKETLQYVRACLGLADVRAADDEWDEVRDALALLEGLDLTQYKAEQDRLSDLRARLPEA